MVDGVLSRKVEITLNSAVSLVQTVQPNFLYLLLCIWWRVYFGNEAVYGRSTSNAMGQARHLYITVVQAQLFHTIKT
jgi:hypothetical protein